MSSFSLDFRSVNSLWGGVLVETLARCGVTHAVLSPGSRSAPLVFAFARHPRIESIPVLDERSAAFFALGLAKKSRRPVALICTSGTAAANLFPAIIEAHESGTPLIVLTADRPPELRDCASGQTVDQQKIYGGYVDFYHELAVPEASEARLRYLRQTVAQACTRAQGGPVHLNCPFRDPLVPTEDGTAKALAKKIDEDFFAHLEPVAPASATATWPPPANARGLIVAGPEMVANPAAYAAAIIKAAETLGWPVLADALSPVRHHAVGKATIITTYDAILRNAPAARELVPQHLICFGGWPVSKVLRGWLEQAQAETLMVSPGPANRDGLHGRTRHLPLSAENFTVLEGPVADPAYATQWSRAESAARASLDGVLGPTDELFEGKAAWLLAQHLPEETPLFVASSMPVRDAEYFWPASGRRCEMAFNRGANGIDGTLSTALGVAHADDRPAVLLTGDLALLHDTNGFLLRPKFRGSLTVVLINNRGGGIFEHLPVAQFEPPFEEFFATPQEADFGKLCSAYGVAHVPVRDWKHFIGLVSVLPTSGVRVLELRTDRKRDAATRKKLFADAANAVERTLA
ncbi:MAG TPA: 2-succinyl-5-enolpyruvyl-6-hydroxy-3-cyclohexene-1-carboxylic-acid synthase [Opitutaceae bacterium]|jgi:2-succinyl-5-enolpyruvyl-6-hydroxy-3-cyclohexene-1-carboxylate synthase|nr:2-succinyl-5-enolpyruvyl-6-hydroxy-3-cyclohexene-1-carboxylic-acid synthase [Opitutaceae bacterium]